MSYGENFTTPGQPAYVSPPPPTTSHRWWVWALAAVAALGFLPVCCCGGCFVYALTVKDIHLSNGEHVGGGPMNIKFDYELKGDDRGPPKSYFIVVRSSDGTIRDRQIGGPFINKRGTLTFSAFNIGENSTVRGPVKVWMETSSFNGGRTTASNTLTIITKKPRAL